MRYEVRQQDGKWIVWDTVTCESLKALTRDFLVSEAYRRFVQKYGTAIRHRLKVANSSTRAILETARPYVFWTQEEAQQWADTWNDIERLGSA